MHSLVESARAMLITSNLPKFFWVEAIATASYVQNQSFISLLNIVTSFQLWNGYSPSINHLRIFGCIVYAHIPNEKQKKWDFKSNKCIFVGYE